MRWFFLLLILHSSCYAAIVCSPVSTALRISLPNQFDWQNESHADGMISSDWHTALNTKVSVCDGSGIYSFIHNASGASLGNYSYGSKNYALYATPIEGVGYIMEIRTVSGVWYPVSAPGFVSWTTNGTVVWLKQQPVALGVRIRLVASRKTLNSGSYSIPSFNVVSSYFNTNTQDIFMGRTTTSGATLVSKSKSCTLSSPSLVKLPESNFSKFQSVGDTSGDTSFKLTLKCADAFVGYTVEFYMTDAYSWSNSGLTLSGQGAVRGIAIQIVDGPRPIRFGSSPTTLNTQTIGYVSGAGVSTLVKQLTARYVRIGSKMSPGLLTSGVTVTFMYD